MNSSSTDPTHPAPKTFAEWRTLQRLRRVDLEKLGMRAFEKRGGKTLMLFPVEWFEFIPTGYHVVNILGAKTAFNANTHSRDGRHGYLAFGLLV